MKRVLGLTEAQINDAWRDEISQLLANGLGLAVRLDGLARQEGGALWLLDAMTKTLESLPPSVFVQFVDAQIVGMAKEALGTK